MKFNYSTSKHEDLMFYENLSRRISIYVMIFYVIIGNLGNILKMIFFLQKPVRCCPCAIYVILSTICDFFTLNNTPIVTCISSISIYFGLGPMIFPMEIIEEKEISLSNLTFWICKFCSYFHMWSSNLALQLLVCASFNRFCMVLKRRSRQRHHRLSYLINSRSTAYLLSSISFVLWGSISIRHLFDVQLHQPSNHCAPEHRKYWVIETASINVFQTILMIIFSILTMIWRQDRFIIQRYQCRNQRQNYRIENQLTSMIIMEMFVVVSTSLPYSTFILYRLMTMNHQKNIRQIIWENIGENFIRLTIFFEPSCGFYIYFFSLTTLKRRLYNIIRQKFRFRRDSR